MLELNNLDSPQLVEAVHIWSGWGTEMMPQRDNARLVARLGPEAAARLQPIIDQLWSDFYQSDARFAADNMAEMGDMAINDFREKHPAVAEDIAKVFAWCYTFDNR